MPEAANVVLAPSSRTTETVLPDWYTNYAMDILSNQQAISNQPYTQYNQPRIASFAPQQQQAFQQAGQAATSYQPGLQQAMQTTQATDPYLGLYAAQPYMGASAQTSASQVGQYMNPYIEQVVNRVGELGARSLREQFLPQISDQFVRAGGYGGSRQAEAIGRSLRDVAESTQAKQAELLAGGYNSSLGAAENDLTRLGTLGQNIASGYSTAGQQQLAQGSQQAELAGLAQSMGITGAGALQVAGAQQQNQAQKNLDLQYQDFLRQQAYPQMQNTALQGALAGVAGGVPKGTLENAIGPANSDSLSKNTNLLQDISNVFTTIAPFFPKNP